MHLGQRMLINYVIALLTRIREIIFTSIWDKLNERYNL